MIAEAHRFHGYSSLSFVYRHGQTVRSPLLSVRYVLNDRRSTWRMAVVVSRKVSKLAVTRNRIRRQIYEAIRLNQGAITMPYDIAVIVFSPSVSELTPAKLSSMLLALLQQAKVITPVQTSQPPVQHDIVDTKED